MGMYTEIYVNVNLKNDTPDDVIELIKKVCEENIEWMVENEHPRRWGLLFCNGSYYTPSTSVANLTYDDIDKSYSLLGKGDIKNYDGEIESFFKFIKPWCEGNFLGYIMHESSDKPELVFKNENL